MAKKIAWIEDDHPEIPSLVRLLELDGHEILRYRTCQDVDKNFQEICECDAVILDIILPPANYDNSYRGVSVLRTLRQQCKHSIPVVVVTVVRNPHVLKALNELGVSAILHKPVRPSKLYEEVTKVLPEGESELPE